MKFRMYKHHAMKTYTEGKVTHAFLTFAYDMSRYSASIFGRFVIDIHCMGHRTIWSGAEKIPVTANASYFLGEIN